jgi:4-hydroxy-2-oxoheptanedioate aldolase
MENSIKAKWSEGKAITNAWVSIPNAWTSEILANLSFDVLTIDAQHGLATDLGTILPMLQAIHGTSAVPFVRLPSAEPAFAMRMLDAGVQGLICPMINTAQDTENFVKATKYYPRGNRSFGPTRAGLLYEKDYFQNANNQTVTMAMIETPSALKNIKDIVKTPDLDGLYVGPWDLSISLGYKKHADFDDPSFWDIMIEIAETAKFAGLNVGIHAGNPSNAQKFIKIGYTFVTILNDSSALKNIGQQTLNEFYKLQNTPKQTY